MLFLLLGRVHNRCRKQEEAEEATASPGELGAGFKVQSPRSSGFIWHPQDFPKAEKALPCQPAREGGREIHTRKITQESKLFASFDLQRRIAVA